MRRLTFPLMVGITFCVLVGLGATPLVAQKKRSSISVPPGTEIQVRLNTPLNTGEAQAGQTFSGTVAEPVVANGRTILAKGTTVKGQVTESVSSGRLKRPASITLVLASVSTEPLKIDGKSHLLRNVALIGGGAGAGAAVGGATGGKKGAAVGAAIGAGAGTLTAFLTGKDEIELPAEMVLPFVAGSGTAPTTTTTARNASKPDSDEDYRDERRGSLERGTGIAEVIFTDRDRQLIHSYFSGTRGLPPGLAKRGGKLPPGLAKQLRKNGTLPPGLQKRAEPFPAELTRQLSPLPSGYSRVLVAGRAIITDGNHRILDLLAIVQ